MYCRGSISPFSFCYCTNAFSDEKPTMRNGSYENAWLIKLACSSLWIFKKPVEGDALTLRA